MDSDAIQRKSMTSSSWDDIHLTRVVYFYIDDDNSTRPNLKNCPTLSHVSLAQHFKPYSHGWAPHEGTLMDSDVI